MYVQVIFWADYLTKSTQGNLKLTYYTSSY